MAKRTVRPSQLLKKELQQRFPGIKFSVKYESFSGGDSIYVSWQFGPSTDIVQEVTRKYQCGSFDGMTDMYEYNTTKAINEKGELVDHPCAKYVSESRSFTDSFNEAFSKDIAKRMKIKWEGVHNTYFDKERGIEGLVSSLVYTIARRSGFDTDKVEYEGYEVMDWSEIPEDVLAEKEDLYTIIYSGGKKTTNYGYIKAVEDDENRKAYKRKEEEEKQQVANKVAELYKKLTAAVKAKKPLAELVKIKKEIYEADYQERNKDEDKIGFKTYELEEPVMVQAEFPVLNKENRLDEYKDNLKEDRKEKRDIAQTARVDDVTILDDLSFFLVSNNLMFSNKGIFRSGGNSVLPAILERTGITEEKYFDILMTKQMSKEERQLFSKGIFTHSSLIYNSETGEAFLADNQGSKYARYVGFISKDDIERVMLNIKATPIAQVKSNFEFIAPIVKPTITQSKKGKPKKTGKTVSTKNSLKLKTEHKTFLHSLSVEEKLLKRYLNLEGKNVPRSRFLNLLKAIQKAITDKVISKTSTYGKLLDSIESRLINVLKKKFDTVENVKLEQAEKKAAEEAVKGKTIYPSINLIKRYIGLTGSSNTVKTNNLILAMEKALSSDKLANDPHKHRVESLLKELKKGNETPLVNMPLSGLKGCKCSSLGKLSTKQMDKLETLVNKKKVAAKKTPVVNHHLVVKKKPVKKPTSNTAPKKPLGNTPSSQKQVTPSVNPKPKSLAITKPSIPGTKSAADFVARDIEPVPVKQKWKDIIGDFELPNQFLLTGDGGSGKSGMALEFLDDLSKLGYKGLYASREQFYRPTFGKLIRDVGIDVNNTTIVFSPDYQNEHINPGMFDVVVLDSKDDFELKNPNDFKNLALQYPNTSFILISHATKKGEFRGSGAWRNVVDTMLEAYERGKMRTGKKNRWDHFGETILFGPGSETDQQETETPEQEGVATPAPTQTPEQPTATTPPITTTRLELPSSFKEKHINY